jgi:hypothetical protein
VTNDLNFVWSPQFLVGTVIAGLLLNIVVAYVVRVVDNVRKALSASYRRAQGEESVRIEELTTAATSANALYAALAAEASRLRLHQLLRFFIAFVCIYTIVFLVAFGEVKPGISVLGLLLIVFLIAMGVIQYSQGLDIGKRARRLDIALRAVQRNRKLPIMD